MKYLICIILSLASVAYGQIGIPCNLTMANNLYTCRLPEVDLSVFDNFLITSDNHLPGQNDGTIQSFISVHNNFRTFPTALIARFTGLVEIKITGSAITELGPGAVANRPALRTLNLNSNAISTISPLAFTGTTQIQDIHLMFNLLTGIDNAVFGQFPQLTVLDLSSNLLTVIPQNTLAQNTQLWILRVAANQIRFLDRLFIEGLLQIRDFNFLNNPCYSGSFVNLQNPALRNEMMQRLTPCFSLAPRRIFCNFGVNFGGIDFDGMYTCLLRGIEVTNIDEAVELTGFHLVGRNDNDVQNVWIDASNVRYILHQAFSTFPNLRRLQVQGSNLQYLQRGAFFNAHNLVELTITMNAVRKLEDNTFEHANSLEVVNLWFNSLEYISEKAFHGIENLREIHLFSGYLTEIHPNTFAPLPNLYMVEIGFNRLTTIDSRWFANNPNIGQLMFNSNQINEIFPAIVDMPNLTTLRLRNNTCIDNEFVITNATRDAVRQELQTCFLNYPLRVQRFEMELEGDLNLIDEEGRIVISL